jgi:hypothetical protein
MAFSIGGMNKSTIFKQKKEHDKTRNLSTQYHSLTNRDVLASGQGTFRTLKDITNNQPERAIEFMQMNQELANKELNSLKREMSHLKNQLSDVNMSHC